jgi:hypothetical protein
MKLNSKPLLLIAALSCLFLALRFCVLLSSLNRLYETEELYRGTVAREMMSAKPLIPLLDYLDYKVEYFPGGTLVVGLLAVPFFVLFGQTYVALKLVGLLFSLAAFVMWFFFVKRYFGSKASLLTALIFIFCAPFYTKTSLLTWGAHPEANFLTAAALFALYRIVYDGKGKWMYFLLGLICGFGLWFVQTFLITILFVISAFFIFHKRQFKPRYLIFGAGGLLGFAPGVAQMLLQGTQVFGVNGVVPLTELAIVYPAFIARKIIWYFLYDLPNAFLFQDMFKLKGVVLSYAYYALFLCAAVFLIAKKSLRSKESLLFLFFVIFSFCYVVSGYSVTRSWPDPRAWLDYIGFRYMIPVMPFVFAMLGIWLSLIRNRAIAVPLACCVLGLGGAANLGLVDVKNFGAFNRDRGFSYNIIGDKIGLRKAEGVGRYIQPFNTLPGWLRNEFYEGLGAGIAWRMRKNDPAEITAFFRREIDEEYRPSLYRGWGTLYFPGYPEEFSKAVSIAQSIAPVYRGAFYEGFGRNALLNGMPQDLKTAIGFIGMVEEKYRKDCYRGLGYRIGFEFKTRRSLRDGMLEQIPQDKRGWVEQGLVDGMRYR